MTCQCLDPALASESRSQYLVSSPPWLQQAIDLGGPGDALGSECEQGGCDEAVVPGLECLVDSGHIPGRCVRVVHSRMQLPGDPEAPAFRGRGRGGVRGLVPLPGTALETGHSTQSRWQHKKPFCPQLLLEKGQLAGRGP